VNAEAEFAIDALAVARLTRLMTEDRVPFGWLRDRVKREAWKHHDASRALHDEPYLVELLECPWCMSMWVSGFVFLIGRRLPGWRLFARLLAASYATGYLHGRE
jgi:hypothetical protein